MSKLDFNKQDSFIRRQLSVGVLLCLATAWITSLTARAQATSPINGSAKFLFVPEGTVSVIEDLSFGTSNQTVFKVKNPKAGNVFPILRVQKTAQGSAYQVRIYGSNYWINADEKTSIGDNPGAKVQVCDSPSCTSLITQELLTSVGRASASLSKPVRDQTVSRPNGPSAILLPAPRGVELPQAGPASNPTAGNRNAERQQTSPQNPPSASTTINAPPPPTPTATTTIAPPPSVAAAPADPTVATITQPASRAPQQQGAGSITVGSATTPVAGQCLRQNKNATMPDLTKISDRDEKEAAFLEYFAPLAVHMQQLTGYPASVALAQFSEESTRGGSALALRSNNFAGIRCQLGPDIEHFVLDSVNGATKPYQFMSECPKGNGGWQKFKNDYEGILGFYSNLLYRPGTPATAYATIRNLSQTALNSGKVANREAIINALTRYSETPEKYKSNLRNHIADPKYNLRVFDQMTVCPN